VEEAEPMRIKLMPGAIELLIGFLAVLPVTMLYFHLLGELSQVGSEARVEGAQGEECQR
jgi:hypothetical protein